MVRTGGTTGEHSRRMFKKAVQQSVKSETLNVNGFGGRALDSPTFHVSPFTVLESEARTPPVEKRVSARRGRAGEKSDFFSILLVG